jgi:GMP synthase-like glutamine amidotransferase
MHIHCFQHVAFETPGTILEWATEHHHSISYTHFFEEKFSFPSLNEIDALLILGGYMNVDEEEQFPWLKAEKQFIKEAITAGKKIIGICLGSQLITASLGSNVYPGREKEIGFFPVTFTDEILTASLFNHFPKNYTVFHWHGDTFDLPDGAQLIASTNVCRHQAYIIGSKVLALQFHFEMNETVLEQMLLHDGHELDEEGTFIHSKEQIRSHYNQLVQNCSELFKLLDKFFIDSIVS